MTGSSFELGTDGPTAIVVGVDGSPTSLRAAAYAAGVARRARTRLVAVYVRRPAAAFSTVADPTGAGLTAAVESQDAVENELRRAFEQQVRTWPVDAQLVVRDGDPFTVLSQVASEVRADSVVVGSSESLGHRISGSLAVRLVRSARWPVTVVP